MKVRYSDGTERELTQDEIAEAQANNRQEEKADLNGAVLLAQLISERATTLAGLRGACTEFIEQTEGV